MKSTTKLVILILTIVLLGFPVWAAESEITGNVKLIGSTAPEAKVEAGYTVKMPFLQGDGPLFSGNNVKFKGILGVSPISVSLTGEAVLTPIAVMEISVGGALGTGWNFDPLELEGLRLWDGIAGTTTSDTMKGMYYKGKAGAALQFDTAAIWPGEWTSVVMRTYHEINIQGYTNYSGTTGGWEFETAGLHQNGLNYKGEYLVGYQMPIILNTVAILLETYMDNIDTNLQIDGMVFDLGLPMNFSFTDSLNLTVIPQLTTKTTHPDTRVMSKTTLGFKRVAAMLNYTF
jgi:hypothetical protein